MRSNNTTAGLWVILAAASLTMLASAAQAGGSADSPPHKVVSFKDLDLNSTEGVAVLYGRIKRAAEDVCGTYNRGELYREALSKGCIDDAISRAIVAVKSPLLTSLYLAKTGKTEKQLIAQVR